MVLKTCFKQFTVANTSLFTSCSLVDGMIAQRALKSNSPIEFGAIKRLIKVEAKVSYLARGGMFMGPQLFP